MPVFAIVMPARLCLVSPLAKTLISGSGARGISVLASHGDDNKGSGLLALVTLEPWFRVLRVCGENMQMD